MTFSKKIATWCLSVSSLSLAPAVLLGPSLAVAAEASFNGEKILTLGDDSALRVAPNRISGTGSFVYDSKLDLIGQGTGHALSFALRDGGSLSFVVYADPSLGQGLEFVFTRAGASLKGLLVRDGDKTQAFDFSPNLRSVDATRIVDLQIDVHNDESPAHILLWNGLESAFDEDNALLNTEEVVEPAWGTGAGLRRGFVLKNAFLFKAVASEVKVDHEH